MMTLLSPSVDRHNLGICAPYWFLQSFRETVPVVHPNASVRTNIP